MNNLILYKMKAMMILKKVSAPMEREFTTTNGEVKKIRFRMVTLDDGVDSIHGETSERLTNRIESTNDALKLNLIEGHVYNVDFTLQARDYKDKQGNESTFLSCTINKMATIL